MCPRITIKYWIVFYDLKICIRPYTYFRFLHYVILPTYCSCSCSCSSSSCSTYTCTGIIAALVVVYHNLEPGFPSIVSFTAILGVPSPAAVMPNIISVWTSLMLSTNAVKWLTRYPWIKTQVAYIGSVYSTTPAGSCVGCSRGSSSKKRTDFSNNKVSLCSSVDDDEWWSFIWYKYARSSAVNGAHCFVILLPGW